RSASSGSPCRQASSARRKSKRVMPSPRTTCSPGFLLRTSMSLLPEADSGACKRRHNRGAFRARLLSDCADEGEVTARLDRGAQGGPGEGPRPPEAGQERPARVGRPRPPHVVEAVPRGRTGKPHDEAALAKMSAAQRRRGVAVAARATAAVGLPAATAGEAAEAAVSAEAAALTKGALSAMLHTKIRRATATL